MKCSIRYKYLWILIPFLLCQQVGAASVASSDLEDAPSQLTVVATTGMVADLARSVIGDRGIVIGIMGEGVDPHLYKPKASDVRLILQADVVFYNGLRLEGRMEDVFANARKRGLPVHAIADGLDTSLLLEDESHPGSPDPHVWMDVEVWSRSLEEIVRVLCRVDPDACSIYQRNAAVHEKQLIALDEEVEAMIATIPRKQRVLVTAHDAFRYFGRAYGIEVHGIQGISTDSEAGLSDLNDRVNFLVEKRIPAVFIESSVSPRNVQALIEGAKSQSHEVVIGGELYSDAMGASGTSAGTYPGMIRHNARVITAALGGTLDVPSSSPPVEKEDPESS